MALGMRVDALQLEQAQFTVDRLGDKLELSAEAIRGHGEACKALGYHAKDSAELIRESSRELLIAALTLSAALLILAWAQGRAR
jgi:predicted ArsR family transcriptional regulator